MSATAGTEAVKQNDEEKSASSTGHKHGSAPHVISAVHAPHSQAGSMNPMQSLLQCGWHTTECNDTFLPGSIIFLNRDMVDRGGFRLDRRRRASSSPEPSPSLSP